MPVEINMTQAVWPNDLWAVPRDWIGQRIYIIGGGPSVAHAGYSEIARLHRTGRVIGCNDAYRLRYCDALIFADRKWLQWPHTRRDLTPNNYEYLIGRVAREEANGDPPFHRLARDMMAGLSRSPQALSGWCCGSNAINLAYLFSAGHPKDIILLGFDMHGANWHNRHLTAKVPGKYERDFIPYIERMAAELRAEGIKVINCSPGSALKCFQIMLLKDVL